MMFELYSDLRGSEEYKRVYGNVTFMPWRNGVLLTINAYNLPKIFNDKKISSYGLHIHQNGDCSKGEKNAPFAKAGPHFDIGENDHGFHLGDLPPLISDVEGYAYLSVYTDRFTITDIVNKSIMIHESSDDFHTNPAGNSGKRIACGVILKM